LTKELDLKILQAIHTIRQRKPEVYSQQGLFPDQDDTEGGESEGEDSEGEEGGSSGEESGGAGTSSAAGVAISSGRGLTIRDQLRSLGASALDSDGGSGGEGEEEYEGIGAAARARQRRQLAYDPEQQELRRALSVKPDATEKKKLGGGSGDGSDGTASGVEDDLLVRRQVPAEERDAEADEYASWLREQLAKEGPVDEAVTLRR
jgi:hypothetical protein